MEGSSMYSISGSVEMLQEMAGPPRSLVPCAWSPPQTGGWRDAESAQELAQRRPGGWRCGGPVEASRQSSK
eukprot:CAMPEP_0170618852 /NCGR_PEP_ID=MMETSP0224-20130122/27188_1 /TAXON_ID=285029 /ORGANISM="Togula jolla, Strain CCCM 725" /LENGTH=70 /DNA_ID=CAMNT_0010944871 /DNA_START=210 /DNA_END=423 /DNA_ORIENTATION=-